MAYNTLARHIRSSIVCIVHLHNEEATKNTDGRVQNAPRHHNYLLLFDV